MVFLSFLCDEVSWKHTGVVLKKLLQMDTLFPLLASFAEAIISLPITNAQPCCGACLSNEMLESLLHISVNGPEVCTEECEPLLNFLIRNCCWQPSVSEDNGNLHLRSKISKAAPPAVAVKPNAGATDPLAFCAGKVICGGWWNGGRLEPLSPASPLHLPLALPLQLGLFDAGLDSRSPECTVGCC